MNDILIIKISEMFEDKEALRERSRKAWKINPKRLDNVCKVVVLHKQEVVAEYYLGEKVIYHLRDRVELELLDVPNNELEYLGKKLNYNTANPATKKSRKDFKALFVNN